MGLIRPEKFIPPHVQPPTPRLRHGLGAIEVLTALPQRLLRPLAVRDVREGSYDSPDHSVG